MALPVKKIYIDSRYRTTDSLSSSNFKFELNRTISLPNSVVFTLNDVSIPHTWYTVEQDLNDKVYIRCPSVSPNIVVSTLSSKNYIGTSFADELKSKITLPGKNVVYDPDTHTVTITSNKPFQVLTDAELSSDPQSINEIIGNVTGSSTLNTTFKSNFLDFAFIRDVYSPFT